MNIHELYIAHRKMRFALFYMACVIALAGVCIGVIGHRVSNVDDRLGELEGKIIYATERPSK